MVAKRRTLELVLCFVGSTAAVTPTAADSAVQLQASLQPPARVRIDAGRFSMGSDDAAIERAIATCLLAPPSSGACSAELFSDEHDAHDVYLSTFTIDRLEVSNESYGRCVATGACSPSGLSDSDVRVGQPEQPVAAVSFRDAQRYCAWVSGRLPTEAEWERAARGNSARSFPWGQIWNARLANHGSANGGESELDGHRFAAPVDAYSDGRSFHGLLNMAGNVAEMVGDRYAAYAEDGTAGGSRHAAVDPQGPKSGAERVVRGGSWRTPPQALRVTARARMAEHAREPDIGFRCAYSQSRARN